ncbi:hypothetical protein C0991_012094 [Blastosporella zonata]|nr:hypothetical protein C0991_012094 [Blastosporella zonata]
MTQPNALSIDKQFATIGKALSHLQIHVVEQLTRQSDDQHSSCHRSIAELASKLAERESENTELSNRLKWLAHQNLELQRQIDDKKPALEKAIDARNAAFRKLRYSYKVIRDFVNDDERVNFIFEYFFCLVAPTL